MPDRARCTPRTAKGEPCLAYPMRGAAVCFRHSPDHREAASEASRLGGLRSRKEATVQVVYDLEGLDTLDGPRRLLEIAASELLSLENSVARNRALVQVAAESRRLIETRELEERVAALELVLKQRSTRRGGTK